MGEWFKGVAVPVVLADGADGEFLLTGTVIAPRAVLTCRHQLEDITEEERTGKIYVSVKGNRHHPSQVLLSSKPDLDLCLLLFEHDLPGVKPLPLLRVSHLEGFSLDAAGYVSVAKAVRYRKLKYMLPVDQGSLFEFQVEGGLKHSSSGGPIVARVGERLYLIGIAYLGGDSSGQSRALAVGAIEAFCEDQKFPIKVIELPSTTTTEGLPSTTVPPLPRNFLARTDELETLVDALLRDKGKRGHSVALAAVEGMGGIGKTVLAQAVCHEPRVIEAFPDGIIWQSIGKDSPWKLTERLRAVRLALGGDAWPQGNELDQYRRTISKKAALVVIDDVWNTGDIQPWLAESPGSCVLFTTRDVSIAAAVGAEEHRVDLLNEEQAREMLAQWSGLSVEAVPTEAEELVQKCGRLPLALSMVGAMLRGKPRALWQHTLEVFRQADLEKIKAAFPDYPYPNLFVAIEASVEALESEERERYRELAVLVEEMAASRMLQRTLWGTNEGEAAETAEKFVSLSLAQREANGESIRLHDLQLKYVHGRYKDQETLALIHGAMRLSWHVIASDSSQFASQLVGRLLAHEGQLGIWQFVQNMTKNAPHPWLRPSIPALAAPGESLVRVLEHASAVSGVALSGDGTVAISGSKDGMVSVWNPLFGQLLYRLQAHAAPVARVSISRDGRVAVSASKDGTAKVWDLKERRERFSFRVSFSPDFSALAVGAGGRFVAYAFRSSVVTVRDLETGALLGNLPDGRLVMDLAICKNDTVILSSSEGHTIKIWDISDLTKPHTLHVLKDEYPVKCIGASADGSVAVSGNYVIRIWNLAHGTVRCTFEDQWATSLAVSADGKRLLSATEYSDSAQVWDLERRQPITRLSGHTGTVNAVALSADGRVAVSASKDKTVKVWDLSSAREFRMTGRQSLPVKAVNSSANGKLVISVSRDGTIILWNTARGCAQHIVNDRQVDEAYGAALSNDGRILAVAISGKRRVLNADDSPERDESHGLRLWMISELYPPSVLCTLIGHAAPVRGVAISADGSKVISASDDGTMKIWDVKDEHELYQLSTTGHRDHVPGVAMSSDGKLAVSAWERELRVWNLDTGCLVHALIGHQGPVNGVALSANGEIAISASADHTLKVWDVKHKYERQTLVGHFGSVRGVAVSPDGRFAGSASRDRTLRFWDVEGGKCLSTFTCDGDALCCALVGNCIIGGDLAGHVYFLTLELKKAVELDGPS